MTMLEILLIAGLLGLVGAVIRALPRMSVWTRNTT
jgi:hypothetical protein